MAVETDNLTDREKLFEELRHSLISFGDEPALNAIEMLERYYSPLTNLDRDRIELARTHLERNKPHRDPKPAILAQIPASMADDPWWTSEWYRVSGSRKAVEGDWEGAYQEFTQGLDVAMKHGDLWGSAANKIMLSKFYDHTGGEGSELSLAMSALDDFLNIKCQYGMALSYLVLGGIHKARHDWKPMFIHYHRALDAATDSGDRQMIVASTAAIAEYHVTLGEFHKALEMFDRALELLNSDTPTYDLAVVKGHMAGIYASLGEEERALKFAQEAAGVAKAMERRRLELQCILDHATICVQFGRYMTAVQDVTEVLDEIVKTNNTAMILFATRIMAQAYYGIGKVDVAMHHVDSYLRLRTGETDPVGYYQLKLLRIKLLRDLGEHPDIKSEIMALLYEIESVDSTRDIVPLQHVVVEAQDLLIEIAEQEGDFREALRLHKDSSRALLKQHTEDEHRRIIAAEAERLVAMERERAESARALALREHSLLSKILPEHVVERMLAGDRMIAEGFDNVAILFLDLVSFTPLASKITPHQLVYLLDAVFETCDAVMERHGLRQIKTIGDAYLAAAGVPFPLEEQQVRAANAALDLSQALQELAVRVPTDESDVSWLDNVGELTFRIGLHSGPVIAGVIGRHRVAYDIWGDAVNVAARMEATCEPGRIQVSESFAHQLMAIAPSTESEPAVFRVRNFILRLRGDVSVKGKGTMTTFWLERE